MKVRRVESERPFSVEVPHLPNGKWPNKAPEPTPGLVTPRALDFAFEMKQRDESRDVARGAPSPVVAHRKRPLDCLVVGTKLGV